jgi:hypothetical protein
MLVFESLPPTEPDKQPSRISFRTKYILASLLLLALVFTIIALNENNGINTKYIGEVRDVRYSTFPTPHTDITYGLKPAPFAAPGLIGPVRDPKLTDGVYVRTATYAGDLRGVFQVGGFYFVSQEKLPFTLYPELQQWQTSEIRSMTLTVYGSGTNGQYSWLNDDNYLVFNGNYYGAFEFMHYYNITWFGDVLLSYSKIS